VIVDVVSALTDSANPAVYIKDMRRRDKELAKGWGQIATPLSMETSGGNQKLNCANTEGLFRIIQTIPSPKAEPFKRWLAKVGYERVQEIEDPELGTARTRELYRAKGYSEAWIGNRGRVRSRSCLPLLIKPCVRFSRTRLSDVLHRKACALVQPAVVGTLYRPYLSYNDLLGNLT
jgi:hypothetical protein